MTGLGLTVSVAGNVGHVAGHDLASRVTAAVPPLAAAAALAVGLGVLKRVVAMHSAAPIDPAVPAAFANGHAAAPAGAPEAARLYAAELARGELPSIRRIRREMHVGQDRAQSIATYLAALTRT